MFIKVFFERFGCLFKEIVVYLVQLFNVQVISSRGRDSLCFHHNYNTSKLCMYVLRQIETRFDIVQSINSSERLIRMHSKHI